MGLMPNPGLGFFILILAVIGTCLFLPLRYCFSASYRARSRGCFARLGVGAVFLLGLAGIGAIVWLGYWGWVTPQGPKCSGPDGVTRKNVRNEWECQSPWIYTPPEPGWRP